MELLVDSEILYTDLSPLTGSKNCLCCIARLKLTHLISTTQTSYSLWLHVFRSPCFYVSVSQVDIHCFLQSSSRTLLFLVGMLSLMCLQAFQHFMVDPDPDNRKCCGINCWIMSHSSALFSLCGQKRRSSGEEILAILPGLRAGPAWQASKDLLAG